MAQSNFRVSKLTNSELLNLMDDKSRRSIRVSVSKSYLDEIHSELARLRSDIAFIEVQTTRLAKWVDSHPDASEDLLRVCRTVFDWKAFGGSHGRDKEEGRPGDDLRADSGLS